MNMPSRPPLATIDEVAAFLNVSSRTVRRILQRGELVHQRLRGTRLIRIPWSAVDAYVRESMDTRETAELAAFIARRSGRS